MNKWIRSILNEEFKIKNIFLQEQLYNELDKDIKGK